MSSADTSVKGPQDVITIKRTGAGFWFVPCEIFEKRCDMLLDSGAMSSLLSKDIFLKHFPGLVDNLEEPKKQLVAANGENMCVIGDTELPLQTGSQTFQTRVTVAELGNLDGIIGLNFLRNLEMNIDLGEGIMSRRNWSIRLQGDRGSEEKSCLVELNEDLCIPQGHEVTVWGTVKRRHDVNITGYCTVDPVRSLTERNVKLVKSVVMNRGRVPLTLANETEEDIELEEGQLVALLSPVQEITELMAVDEYSPANENRRENDKPKVLPAHLTFLLDDSGSKLNGEEKRELEKLLIEFEDVFVGPDGKLGRTNLVTHSIDTGDAPPVRQRPRRVPYSQVEALDTETENMLEQGIIRPSCSP